MLPKMDILLACFGLVLLCITPSEATPVNPECQGLQNLANHMKAVTASSAVQGFGLRNMNCHVFRNCSGLWCSGNMKNDNFNASLYLEHCLNPIKILLHLKVPNENVDEWRLFENGKSVTFQLPVPVFGTVPLTITPYLSRNGSDIVVKFRGCAKTPLTTQPICRDAAATSIQVSRKTCPTDKPGSATTAKEAKASPKPTISTDKPKGPTKKTTNKAKKNTSAKPKPETSPTKSPKSQHPKTTQNSSSTKINSLSTTTKKSPETGKVPTPAHKKQHNRPQKSGSHGMSIGSKVAIVVSVVLVCLLVVGLVAYWRKLKRRGPMYYNDIFVNRDSNSGFDDEEPLFDSHLVL